MSLTSAVAAGVVVLGNELQLERLLRNLLDNAERHARSAVQVTVRVDGDHAVVELGDDGPGIPLADRARVFDRFVRLDESRSHDDGGAGLGLAIAREIVVRHGGTIEIGSSPSGGAAVTVRLPLGGDAEGS